MTTPPAPDARFAGVEVPVPDFAHDDGAADPALAALLAAHAAGAARRFDVVTALLRARLLVPVVAVLDEADDGTHEAADGAATAADATAGLRRERSSHMAAVSIVAPDGRRGLLAFTGTASLATWRPDARPIPVTAVAAAAAALSDGADALLIDVAGPARLAVSGAGLRALAGGRPWLPPGEDPEVVAAIAAVMAADADVVAVRLAPPDDEAADVVLLLTPRPGHDAAEVPEVARAAAERLAAHPVLRDRLERGLSLALDG